MDNWIKEYLFLWNIFFNYVKDNNLSDKINIETAKLFFIKELKKEYKFRMKHDKNTISKNILNSMNQQFINKHIQEEKRKKEREKKDSIKLVPRNILLEKQENNSREKENNIMSFKEDNVIYKRDDIKQARQNATLNKYNELQNDFNQFNHAKRPEEIDFTDKTDDDDVDIDSLLKMRMNERQYDAYHNVDLKPDNSMNILSNIDNKIINNEEPKVNNISLQIDENKIIKKEKKVSFKNDYIENYENIVRENNNENDVLNNINKTLNILMMKIEENTRNIMIMKELLDKSLRENNNNKIFMETGTNTDNISSIDLYIDEKFMNDVSDVDISLSYV